MIDWKVFWRKFGNVGKRGACFARVDRTYYINSCSFNIQLLQVWFLFRSAEYSDYSVRSFEVLEDLEEVWKIIFESEIRFPPRSFEFFRTSERVCSQEMVVTNTWKSWRESQEGISRSTEIILWESSHQEKVGTAI